MTQFTKDSSVYVSHRWQAWNVLANPIYTQGGGSTKLVRTRVGSSNPNYLTQIMNDQNATTDMTADYDSYWSEPGTYWVLYKNPNAPQDSTIYRNYIIGDLVKAAAPSLPDWALTKNDLEARNDAAVNFLKKVRKVQVSFSTPTFLGELREALHMIRHPAEALRHMHIDPWLSRVKAMKHKNPRTWKAALGGAWLEQAFGWSPLINDINSAYKAFLGTYRKRTKVSVRSFGIRDYLVPARCLNNKPVPMPGNTSIGARLTCRAIERYVIVYRGKVVRTPVTTYEGFLTPFGLGPNGFEAMEWAPTAWELLPWSFLIDYFSNIGDVITAECAFRSTICWANSTSVRTRSVESALKADLAQTDLNYPRYVDSGGFQLASKHVNRHVQRQANVIIPYPHITLSLPGRPAQWANMTALLAIVNSGIHPQTFFKTHRYG
jgi:hypothetical protein